jgi:hypothetical protein
MQGDTPGDPANLALREMFDLLLATQFSPTANDTICVLNGT